MSDMTLKWRSQDSVTMVSNETESGLHYTIRPVKKLDDAGKLIDRWRLSQWEGVARLKTEVTTQPYTLAEEWESTEFHAEE